MKLTRCAWAVLGVGASALLACGASVSPLEPPPYSDSSNAGNPPQSLEQAGFEQPVGGGGSPPVSGAAPREGNTAPSGAGTAGGGVAISGSAGAGTAGFGSVGSAGLGSVTGPDGLRASYSFDETMGSYATEALSQARAPIYLASRLEGVFGNALSFGAPSARVELFPLGRFYTDELSVELWVRPNSLAPSATAHLIGDGGGGIESFRVELRGSKVVLLLASGDGSTAQPIITSKSSVEVGRWQLVTVTFDGSTARVYLDGAEDAVEPVLSPVPVSANTLYVGALLGPNNQTFEARFDGAIDELKVWDEAVPPDAVAAHFQARQ